MKKLINLALVFALFITFNNVPAKADPVQIGVGLASLLGDIFISSSDKETKKKTSDNQDKKIDWRYFDLVSTQTKELVVKQLSSPTNQNPSGTKMVWGEHKKNYFINETVIALHHALIDNQDGAVLTIYMPKTENNKKTLFARKCKFYNAAKLPELANALMRTETEILIYLREQCLMANLDPGPLPVQTSQTNAGQ